MGSGAAVSMGRRVDKFGRDAPCTIVKNVHDRRNSKRQLYSSMYSDSVALVMKARLFVAHRPRSSFRTHPGVLTIHALSLASPPLLACSASERFPPSCPRAARLDLKLVPSQALQSIRAGRSPVTA